MNKKTGSVHNLTTLPGRKPPLSNRQSNWDRFTPLWQHRWLQIACSWLIVIIIFGGFCANFSFEFWQRGAGILRGGGWCFWCANLSCRSLEIAAWRTALNYHLSCPKPHIFSYFMRTRRLCILCSLVVFCLAFLVSHTFCNINFSWELRVGHPQAIQKGLLITSLKSCHHFTISIWRRSSLEV